MRAKDPRELPSRFGSRRLNGATGVIYTDHQMRKPLLTRPHLDRFPVRPAVLSGYVGPSESPRIQPQSPRNGMKPWRKVVDAVSHPSRCFRLFTGIGPIVHMRD